MLYTEPEQWREKVQGYRGGCGECRTQFYMPHRQHGLSPADNFRVFFENVDMHTYSYIHTIKI